MRWRGNQEYSQEIGDVQAPPDAAAGPSDMLGTQQSVDEMQRTPLGEPRVAFDVRSVYDSRPVNAYDFNFSKTVSNVTSTTNWSATFIVPNGYRIVPLEWEIYFDSPAPGPSASSTATIQQNGANLPYNGPIIIGMGTSDPIKTFFICEENTTFGVIGANNNFFNTNFTVNINVYGNLLPVTDVALPFEVTNRKYAT